MRRPQMKLSVKPVSSVLGRVHDRSVPGRAYNPPWDTQGAAPADCDVRLLRAGRLKLEYFPAAVRYDHAEVFTSGSFS